MRGHSAVAWRARVLELRTGSSREEGLGGLGGGLGGFKCTTVVRLLPHPVSVNKGRDMCEPWMDEQGEDHTHAHQSDGISEKREA